MFSREADQSEIGSMTTLLDMANANNTRLERGALPVMWEVGQARLWMGVGAICNLCGLGSSYVMRATHMPHATWHTPRASRSLFGISILSLKSHERPLEDRN